MLLITSCVLKDLTLARPIERCMALAVVDALFTAEMGACVIEQLTRLLSAAEDVVRQRACLTLCRLAQRYRELEPSDVVAHIARLLADRSPSVLAAALVYLGELLARPGPAQVCVHSSVDVSFLFFCFIVIFLLLVLLLCTVASADACCRARRRVATMRSIQGGPKKKL